MLRSRSVGVRGTVAMVSLAWLAGLAPADGDVASSPDDQQPVGVTTRVSVGPGGAQTEFDFESWGPSVSAGGRYVAFSSDARNLVAGDTNGFQDVFVRDRGTRVTRRVSVGPGGAQANSWSFATGISAGGRYVLLTSDASNLVAGDTNTNTDVFVRDRVAHVTRRVSVARRGAEPNGTSASASMSPDGRYVAFDSGASNLVAGDTNTNTDVFVRDLVAHVTRRVSVGPGGAQANNGSVSASISADGRYVAFTSYASNLVAGDTNNNADVFVRDRVAHVTRRVSVRSSGGQGNRDSSVPSISAHGRYVVFESDASTLVAGDTNRSTDVFVRDRVAHVTRRVSVGRGGQANGFSSSPVISAAGGRYVAFTSDASNLVAGDTNTAADMLVRDRVAHVTLRVSVSSSGAQGNGDSSSRPSISEHGRHVAFYSQASNLVAGDTNNAADVFINHLFN